MKLILLLSTLLSISCSHSRINTSTPSYDARLSQYKYPFKVYNFKFSSQKNQLEMAYMDIGPKNSKKSIVLLHGKNFSGFYWEAIAEKLSQMGYRVIIPDQIGFGKSSKPKNYQYSFPQLALNTKNLLSSLGIDKFSVVGHSMGGMLAITMTNMYDNNVSHLTLINPVGLETYLNYARFKDADFFYKNELTKTKEKIISYQKKNYYDGLWDKSYEDLIAPTSGQINHKDWPTVAWSNALTYGPIFSEDTVARLKNIKVPSTLIIGTRDRTGPGRFWKKPGVTYKLGQYQNFKSKVNSLNPKINVIELKGLGHMPQYEDFETFSNVFFKLF